MDKSIESNRREEDFSKAFERLLAEYRMDRTADIFESLQKDTRYKELLENKVQKEMELKASIINSDIISIFLDYVTSVDSLLDEIQAIYYENGFQDCITISKTIHKNLYSGLLRTLIELDKE